MTSPRLLRVEDLCLRLQVGRGYIYRLVHERRIPFIKLGHRQLRFSGEAIEEWLVEKTTEARDKEGSDVFR